MPNLKRAAAVPQRRTLFAKASKVDQKNKVNSLENNNNVFTDNGDGVRYK
jgi:hypothetical protein